MTYFPFSAINGGWGDIQTNCLPLFPGAPLTETTTSPLKPLKTMFVLTYDSKSSHTGMGGGDQ